MEVNELRARREKLQQCLSDFDKLLETEDLSPINRSYAEDLKKIGKQMLDATDSPSVSSNGQPFHANVPMSDLSNVLQSLAPAFSNFQLIALQQAQASQYQLLVAANDRMLLSMQNEREAWRNEREASQKQINTLIASQTKLTLVNGGLLDKLAKAEAWNMFYEIVHLYECSVWWRHTKGLKRSLNRAIDQHVVSEAEVSEELGISVERVPRYLRQIQEVKREREKYGHLADHMKALQREGVKKMIDEYAGKHGVMLDRFYRHLAGADADITLQQIQKKIDILRMQNCTEDEEEEDEDDE